MQDHPMPIFASEDDGQALAVSHRNHPYLRVSVEAVLMLAAEDKVASKRVCVTRGVCVWCWAFPLSYLNRDEKLP